MRCCIYLFLFHVNFVNVVNEVEGSWSCNYVIMWRDLENILLNNITSYCAGIECSDGAKDLATGLTSDVEGQMTEWTPSKCEANRFLGNDSAF